MTGPGDKLSATELSGIWGGLRPLAPERDARRLYALSHDASVAATWAEMKVGPFATEAAFVDHVAELAADEHRAFFAVVGTDGEAAGWLCLMEASQQHSVVELGYVLYAPPLQRTTLATEAFLLVISHAFEDLGFQRLEWTCTADNARSRRAADRLGFQFEGVMRRKLVLKGVARDIAMYALLAEDWPRRKAALTAWLDPSNFDDGVQRRPLR